MLKITQKKIYVTNKTIITIFLMLFTLQVFSHESSHKFYCTKFKQTVFELTYTFEHKIVDSLYTKCRDKKGGSFFKCIKYNNPKNNGDEITVKLIAFNKYRDLIAKYAKDCTQLTSTQIEDALLDTYTFVKNKNFNSSRIFFKGRNSNFYKSYYRSVKIMRDIIYQIFNNRIKDGTLFVEKKIVQCLQIGHQTGFGLNPSSESRCQNISKYNIIFKDGKIAYPKLKYSN